VLLEAEKIKNQISKIKMTNQKLKMEFTDGDLF